MNAQRQWNPRCDQCTVYAQGRFGSSTGCGAAVCSGRSVRNVRILGKTMAMARLRAPGRRYGRRLRGACAPWRLALPPISVGSAGRGCDRRGAQDPPPAVRDGPNAWDIWLWGSPWRGALRREGGPLSSEACGTLCWTELPRELCPARVGNMPRRSATRRLRGHAPVRCPCWPPCSRRLRSWARLSA